MLTISTKKTKLLEERKKGLDPKHSLLISLQRCCLLCWVPPTFIFFRWKVQHLLSLVSPIYWYRMFCYFCGASFSAWRGWRDAVTWARKYVSWVNGMEGEGGEMESKLWANWRIWDRCSYLSDGQIDGWKTNYGLGIMLGADIVSWWLLVLYRSMIYPD